ncbi:hypothetical protein ACDX78_06555 [Virgibacillus oceani]
MEITAGLLFYAGFLFFTLVTAIVSNFKNRLIPFAYITIILSLAVPLMNLLFITGKPADITSTSYLLQEFQARNLWAVLLIIMYIYLAAWIVLFIYTLYGKSFNNGYRYVSEKWKELWMYISKKIKELKKQKSMEKERKAGEK